MSMHSWLSFPNTESHISLLTRRSPDSPQVQVMISGSGRRIKKVVFNIISTCQVVTRDSQDGREIIDCLRQDVLVTTLTSILLSPPCIGLVIRVTKTTC